MMQMDVDKKRISLFCQKHQIKRLALFGSVLREDFRPESDVDVLVTFFQEAKPSLFDMVRMQQELKEIFYREVDLLDQATIERSPNYLRRKSILSSQEVIYAA